MLLQKILTLYPNTLVDTTPDSPEDYFELSVQSRKLYIPYDALDSNAIALLELLNDTQRAIPTLSGNDAAWQQFLLHHHPLQTPHKKIRCLHIKLPAEQFVFDRALWSETLSSASQNVIASIPIDTHHQLLIVSGEATSDALIDEFNGLLNTMNADFELQTHAYLGQLHVVDQTLPHQFQQEHDIIVAVNEHHTRTMVTPITVALLHTIGHEASLHYPLLTQLKQVIAHSAEYSSTIQALVDHQGNLTHAADTLFIHRNTLTYRISKFAKETGLNLQYLPDLMLCYLAL